MMCSLMTFRETGLDVNSRAQHNGTTHAQNCQPAGGELELPSKVVSFLPILLTTSPYTQGPGEVLAGALGSKSFPWDWQVLSTGIFSLYPSTDPRSNISA